MVFGVQIKKLIGYYRMSQIKGCIDFRAFLINHINRDSSFLSLVHITADRMFNSRTHLTKKNSKEMIVGKERMKELVLKGKLYLF